MKYIIEIEDSPLFTNNGNMLWKAKDFNTLVFDQEGLDRLEEYREPDTKKNEPTEPNESKAKSKNVTIKYDAENNKWCSCNDPVTELLDTVLELLKS